jgi:hypothetical protein
MKSDREFLAGVYLRARRIAAEEEAATRWFRPTPLTYGQRAAAAALIVLLPLVLILSVFLAGDMGYRRLDGIHLASFSDAATLTAQSDLVVIGRFTAFATGRYQASSDTVQTAAVFQVWQSFKSDAPAAITVLLQGGKDPYRRVYADLETERSTALRQLLFLRQDEDGVYRLTQGASGAFQPVPGRPDTYINRDLVEITIGMIEINLQGEK